MVSHGGIKQENRILKSDYRRHPRRHPAPLRDPVGRPRLSRPRDTARAGTQNVRERFPVTYNALMAPSSLPQKITDSTRSAISANPSQKQHEHSTKRSSKEDFTNLPSSLPAKTSLSPSQHSPHTPLSPQTPQKLPPPTPPTHPTPHSPASSFHPR